MTTYVALGYQSDGSYTGLEATVLAVSRDKARLDAFVVGLVNPNPVTGTRTPYNKYVHAGQTYLKVQVVGPVTDLDGPHVVVANNVGTINM